jgi:steroid Delta-isomerase
MTASDRANGLKFTRRFRSDATMRCVGIPVGPFIGREAIAAGCASQPPSDMLTVNSGISSGDVDKLWFAWEGSGTTGTMVLHWSGGRMFELTVTFS